MQVTITLQIDEELCGTDTLNGEIHLTGEEGLAPVCDALDNFVGHVRVHGMPAVSFTLRAPDGAMVGFIRVEK